MSLSSDRSEDQREKRERYFALQRRKNELRSQIALLESKKTEYIGFRNSISVLERNLIQLNKKLSVTADGLINGLIIDGVPIGESYARENAQLSSKYASELTENYVLIDNKIALITTEINSKNIELSSLR